MTFSQDFLQAVVDGLLPGLPATPVTAALPAASQLGVDQQLAQHLTHHRDALLFGRALETIIKQAGSMVNFVQVDESTANVILQTVEQTEAEAFQALLFIVSADYYENEAVLQAFNWRASPPQPLGYPLSPFDGKLLVAVKDRQKLWRSIGKDGQSKLEPESSTESGAKN